jgi:hypothetical protein
VKTKNLVILTAIVLAFAAYIVLFERHRPSSEEAREAADRVLPDFDRDRVVALLIERDGSRLRLEKADDSWRIAEPIDFPADSSTLSSMLGSLASLDAERRLPLSEVSLADYGLDPPAGTLVLTMDDGSEISVGVGSEMPLGSRRALRVADADEIDITPGWFMSDLERDLDDWRSREVVDLLADQVASIDIRAGSDSIRAARVGDEWRLLSPLEDVADRDHLQGLVSDLGALRIEEFLDGDVDLRELGLEEPEYELVIVRSDGVEPVRLDFGTTREGEGGAEVAVRRGDSEYFWAADRVRTRLAKAPVLWRSKKVRPFETWNVEGLRLHTPDDAVELEKADFQWRTVVDGAEVDQSRVLDRLQTLSSLEATDYDLMAPLSDEIGRAEVVLGGADDGGEHEIVSFTFYAPLNEGGRAMVRVSGRETVMGVDASEARRIFDELDDLGPEPEEESPEALE